MLWSCLGRFCCTWRAERLYHHMQNQILLLSRSLSTSLQSGTSHRGHNSIQQSLTERAGYWQPFLQHRAPPFTAPAGTSPPLFHRVECQGTPGVSAPLQAPSTAPLPFSRGSFPSWFWNPLYKIYFKAPNHSRSLAARCSGEALCCCNLLLWPS